MSVGYPHYPHHPYGMTDAGAFPSVAPIIVDPTASQYSMKALELACAHWSSSTYPSVFAMADDLCAWLHGQRQEPKGE